MIAALYSSRCAGSNKFEKDGVLFGWKPIEDMLHREVQRKKNDELPRVPGLKENFVYRDPWTRLNVKPAKIMQASTFFYVICLLCVMRSKSMSYQNWRSTSLNCQLQMKHMHSQ